MSQHARRARHMAYQEGSRRKGARLRLRQTPIHRISCCEEPSAHVGRFCSSNHQNATNRRQTDYRERVCTAMAIGARAFHRGFQEDPTKYDFILCANVLSAIPLANVRSMTLRRLAGALEKKGRCLFVTQYRHSCFKEMARSNMLFRISTDGFCKHHEATFTTASFRKSNW